MRNAAALPIALLLTIGTLTSLPAPAQASKMRVVAGRGTAAPSFVTGIRDEAKAATPLSVARSHLNANPARYHVDVGDLKALEVLVDGSTGTVRFGQTYKGLDVFGAQYLVHMNRSERGWATRSVNGHLFTELDVDVTPQLTERDASRIAVHRMRGMVVERVERHGATLLPMGSGVPTFHFTLWGRRLTGGQARHEVFIGTKTGAAVLSYNNLQTDGPAVGSGVGVHGDEHVLNIYQRGDLYEMRDQSRPMFASNGGEITTHDADQAPSDEVAPTDQNIVTDDDTSFIGSKFTSTGAVDAHWGTGQVYEFYRALGRNSIDGNGMDMVSLVNVSNAEGNPLYNASWNGSYMTYGNPSDGEVWPFSAGLDVVGHELTHGVIEFSAGLLSMGQAGVMNEAYADYFGNAIDVNESATPMDAPGVGYVGEDLCAVPEPEHLNCPVRNLNTSRTTEDFILFLVDFDSGGIHINAPIYGAALWDIREALGGPAADRLIYKALTEFTTPIDTMLDGRRSVVAAAESLGYSDAQKQAVAAAFDKRGIVDGWDSGTGSDALTLITNHSPLGFEFSAPNVSGGRFIAGHYADLQDVCCAPEEIYVGRVDGSGTLDKIGEDDKPGTVNDELPDISGKRTVWAHATQGPDGFDFDVHTRKLGARVRPVAGGSGWQWYPAVDGNLVAWEEMRDGSSDIWARRGGHPAVHVSAAEGDELQPDVAGNWIAYWDPPEGDKGRFKVRVENIETGARNAYSAGSAAFLGPPSISARYVYWYQDKNPDHRDDLRGSIIRAELGSGRVEALIPEYSGRAPYWGDIASLPVVSGNDNFVAYSDEYGYLARIADPGVFPASETGRDVWLISSSGGDPKRVTCNRGDQAYPAIGKGRRVVWMDSALGRTDLVTRPSPPNAC